MNLKEMGKWECFEGGKWREKYKQVKISKNENNNKKPF